MLLLFSTLFTVVWFIFDRFIGFEIVFDMSDGTTRTIEPFGWWLLFVALVLAVLHLLAR
ncbi:hypothetical protein HPC37_02865 [Pasteurellaceae bacterium 20609_3]|uniref:hypothetical protein n=1 Tax=Spirabiliibacterium mucosae TaxID=28156 RepID=UPI001AADD8E7|nr:hypothetical protein [Spirabiliibacterium mucosae]MBE2897796.1 hypothetical protein [Spirabiliibacterium mucosae]